MKKLLSIILATAMLISLIPAVFASDTDAEKGIKVVYDFKSDKFADLANEEVDSLDLNELTYAESKGFWQYADIWDSNDTLTRTSTGSRPDVTGYIKVIARNPNVIGTPEYYWMALKLNIPKNGDYSLAVTVDPTYKNTYVEAYIFDASSVINVQEGIKAGEPLTSSKTKDGNETTLTFTSTTVKIAAGDYYFVFVPRSSYRLSSGEKDGSHVILKSLTLTEGDGSLAVPMISSLSADGNKVTAVAAKMSDGEDATGVTYSYAVAADDATLASVDATTGVVSGLANGTATIIATATKDGLSSSKSIEVAVTAPVVEPEEPGEAVENTNVSVAVQPENTDEGTVSWDGETIDEVQMGDTVTATATAKEGYVFRYWKNSSGQILSENPNESFVINTNSAITAVFDKVDENADTVNVELYNANGMPFDQKSVNKGTAFAEAIADVAIPTYTGFGTFKHWSMYADESKIADDMLVKENTRAVAIFNAPTAKYTVKVNDAVKHSDVLYGTEVTVSSDASDFSCWKLGDEIVSYNPNYKFTVWENVNLTEVTGEEITEAPVAVLDEVDGNPLLIYSVPENYTIVEAGLLFGSTSDINIYSVDGGRAVAARATGQFTAQPKNAVPFARGYLIFKNAENEIRIIYAD